MIAPDRARIRRCGARAWSGRTRRSGDRGESRLSAGAVPESPGQRARRCHTVAASRGRLRFLREVIADMRGKVRDGLRGGAAHFGHRGRRARPDARRRVCEAVTRLGDEYRLCAHHARHLRDHGRRHAHRAADELQERPTSSLRRTHQRAHRDCPVFVTGRINQPQDAEALIAPRSRRCVRHDARADLRSGNAEQEPPRGAAEDIRACIACNQACIGHFHKGYPISCIQNPVSGRELRFGTLHAAQRRRKVMVVGGGPAGMKAAVVAAQRGHQVTLFEAERRLGGQALLAQMLPGRAEFGGLVTNLLARIAMARECRCNRHAYRCRRRRLARRRMSS